MEPNYYEGDHVLTFNWISPKEGDVIVFRANGEFFMKRINKITKSGIYVSGDNVDLSSRIEPIQPWGIVGKVISKY